MQGLLSLHARLPAPLHVPDAHASLVVQALPSLQLTLLSLKTQPDCFWQASSVQILPSLQVSAAPPLQLPPLQVSLVVQASPSLQPTVLALWTQPILGSQLSLVQPLSSSQASAAPPLQLPPLQASLWVHVLPSLHAALLLPKTQPDPALQLSLVQTLPSTQPNAAPALQTLAAQTSLMVHALPSLHGDELALWTQPALPSQLSSVQTLPSLQFGDAPPLQLPWPQVSEVVQALPSLQGCVLGLWLQPLALSHPSFVHGLLSSQAITPPPLQTPDWQASSPVHALPSLQAPVLSGYWQPTPGWQPSVVHGLPSLHVGPPLPLQTPPSQPSTVVQALPSLQALLLALWTQPLPGSQLSLVHTLSSSHLAALPALQLPPPHWSPMVHALPSLHFSPLAVN